MLMSDSHDARSIGFHVLVCGTFGACFALYRSNWLPPCKLEVGVGVGCKAPHVRFVFQNLQMYLVGNSHRCFTEAPVPYLIQA